VINLAASPLLIFAFMVLTMAVVTGWFAGVWVSSGAMGWQERTRAARLIRIAVTTLAWMVTTILLAASGVLLHFDWRPPPMLLLIVASLGVAAWIGFSPLGRQLAGLPLAGLVGFQVFRWPLELIMHRGFQQGFVPIQMTYAGRNFDIVTGVTAAILGMALVRIRVPRAIVLVWNVMGLLLLANVLTIAVLSMPMLRRFGPDQMNVWVAMPPFVWLPAVLVVAALSGHIIIFRRLLRALTIDE
jgi:hypothetical protein